jgi:two-component system response regulator LytT
MISIHAIRQVHPYFSQKLKLSLLPENKQEVLISKLKAARFKAWLDQ